MNLRVLQDTSNFAPLPSVADIFNLDSIAKGIFSFRVISLKIMYLNFLNDLVCFQSRLGLLFSFRALQYVSYLFTFFSKVFQFSSFFFFGSFVFVFVNLYYLLDNPDQAFIDRANLSGNQRASILSVLVLFFLLTI